MTAAHHLDEPQPVLRLVGEDIPDTDLTDDELGSRIVGLAGRLAAATCRWLLLVAAFDAREGHARFGLPSTGHWLAHYCSLSTRTARDHVRAARALAAHPQLATAMAAGRLSYSHVRAISRVAALGDPSLVESLIMIAEHGTVGQLEDMVRGLRTVDDEQRADRHDVEREALSHRWRSDSLWGLSARLDPEHGALVQSAIETIARREGVTRPQALARMAEIALAASSAEQPAPSLRGDEHAAVVIHLDASAVPPEGDTAETGATQSSTAGSDPAPNGSAEPLRPRPYSRVSGGPGLPDAVVKRLACSGRIRTLVFDPRRKPGDPPIPLDVGGSRRLVSDRQYRPLLARHAGRCTHPGCRNRAALEAHHVRHWLYGGKTVMANLVLLCRRHHHAHHEGEFRIVPLGRGRFRFVRADGSELPRHVDAAAFAGASRPIEEGQPEVAKGAATTRWDGSRLSHGYAIAVLAQGLHSTAGRRA